MSSLGFADKNLSERKVGSFILCRNKSYLIGIWNIYSMPGAGVGAKGII